MHNVPPAILADALSLNTQLIAALISGIISLLVGLFIYKASLTSTEKLYKSKERELERKMTDKLMDLRLKFYPEVFEIMSKLNENEIKYNDLDKNKCIDIRKELVSWKNKKVVFLLSRTAYSAYYKLYDSLTIQTDGMITPVAFEEIVKAKNTLIDKLREDVKLIFGEDQDRSRQ